MKELEEENRRLKQMYANLSLEHEVLKDIIEKNSLRYPRKSGDLEKTKDT